MKPTILKHMCLVLLILWLCPLMTATAKNRVEKDLNEDSIIDQVLIYDESGTIVQADMDPDQDGFFEKRQYYTGGSISRIERDTNGDRQMDCTDFLNMEKESARKGTTQRVT